ncbi:MAG: prephenate dehydrogenase/arogenate dehydrogenase family protein, partial [Parcubacteria group bacterium]|nr:prephenate dehydrogenase/arogenate dehydrogenase family protein [Parcubacteria group bacterium]
MNIAIFGGEGQMGKLVARILKRHRVLVHAIGRKTKNVRRILEKSDVILFSLPFHEFSKTVESLSRFHLANKLLVDFSSCVSRHIRHLRTHTRTVAFIHFMFGPDITALKNQHIVFSERIANKHFQTLIDIFRKEGASLVPASPERHDTMMASVQALSQFSSIALAKTLTESHTAKVSLEDFASLTFSLNAEVISRIVKQNADLWASIQFENPYFPKVLSAHLHTVEELIAIVRTKDMAGFRTMFKKVTSFWKDEQLVDFAPQERTNIQTFRHNTAAILGPAGTYSQEALSRYDSALRPLFFDSIHDALAAIRSGTVARALLPFENSIHGTVLETLDGIYRTRLKIIAEVVLDIKHCIAGIDPKVPARDRKFIYSHPQALEQCKTYIQKKYPRAQLILTPSTAAAFQKIKNEGRVDSLAIGPPIAAKT